jgi:hypothetical protein
VKTKPTETAPADPVALARAEVQRLNDSERELAKLYRVKAAELLAARSKRGDDVLAANDPGAAARDSSRQITVMVEELAALADAAAAARRQRMVAIPRVFAVEADDLDRQAAQHISDAAANEAAVREALKAVETIADCPYVPQPPRAPDRAVGAGQQGVGSIAIFNRPVPLFQRMRMRAEGLRLEAAQRRLNESHKAGSVDADGLEQLVELVFSDPMRVGPSVDEISSWHENAVAKVRKRRQQLELEDVPANVLHLEWVNASIVSSSFVSSPTPIAPTAQAHGPKNVLFESSKGEQTVDLDAEYARAAATGAVSLK